MVPIDAKLEQADSLAVELVDLGAVLTRMESAKRVSLIFLDACRDNPLGRKLALSSNNQSVAPGPGLAARQGKSGTMIAFATQPDNVALDGEGRNSPFTTALLRHIPSRSLDIGFVMRRVRAQVIALTLERQVPWDHSSLLDEEVLAR